MRVIRMGVGRMMVVVVPMIVMMMVVPVMMVVVMVRHVQPALAGTKRVTQLAIGYIGSRRTGALTFHVMVMAFLHRPDLGFKSQYGHTILAHHASRRWHFGQGRVIGGAIFGGNVDVPAILSRQNLGAKHAGAAIGWWVCPDLFDDAFCKGFQHFFMVVQVSGLHKGDLGMLGGDLVGKAINPVNQDAGEQEIGKYDHPAVAKARNVVQTWLYQRECNPGITDFAPAQAQAFLQEPCDLADIGVGVRVGCADPAGRQIRSRAGWPRVQLSTLPRRRSQPESQV